MRWWCAVGTGVWTMRSMALNTASTAPTPTAASVHFLPSGSAIVTVAEGVSELPEVTYTDSSCQFSSWSSSSSSSDRWSDQYGGEWWGRRALCRRALPGHAQCTRC
jgi:hypothetical protein